MSKKKIIIIGSAHPLRGGLAAFNERLARAFSEAGHDVSILTFSLQYPAFLFPGKTQFSSEPAPQDIPITVAVNSINPLNWIKWGLRIKKAAPDLVIMKFWIPFIAPCLGTIARLVRKNHKTKVITILDNLIPHEKRLFDHSLAGYFANSVDGFVAMSREVYGQIGLFNQKGPRLFSPHPIYDIFGPIIPKETARRQLNLDPQGKYLLFFGFIRDYKGLDLLLQAMADERIIASELKLIVAGEFYTNPEPYHQLIEKYELTDHVILHADFIPDSKVGLYFSAADLVVQPYKSATQSGITQIAYHFEVPMIITNVGGLSEFVPHEKAGYIVDVNPPAIAQGILRYFTEKDNVDFIGNIRQEKEKYSWSYFAENILELNANMQSPTRN
ncbi:MAG: glycosyltransferase [Bacteroidales bacterium]|nr:glycosyltransferase [Bacteroidales bacterium]MDZ4205558.1 glycosyltransferase [Bacteroidales bacterium]